MLIFQQVTEYHSRALNHLHPLLATPLDKKSDVHALFCSYFLHHKSIIIIDDATSADQVFTLVPFLNDEALHFKGENGAANGNVEMDDDGGNPLNKSTSSIMANKKVVVVVVSESELSFNDSKSFGLIQVLIIFHI